MQSVVQQEILLLLCKIAEQNSTPKGDLGTPLGTFEVGIESMAGCWSVTSKCSVTSGTRVMQCNHGDAC